MYRFFFLFPSGLCRLHDLCAGGMEFTVHGLYIKNKDSFLNLDVQAMDEECAEETWVWIYVFIVLAVPTIIGSILKSTLYGVLCSKYTRALTFENLCSFQALFWPSSSADSRF